MPKQLILATTNSHKLNEIKQILKNYNILSLKDINFNQSIEETGDTFEQNALIKCQEIYKIANAPVIADDSGLCVNALNDQPGVRSARFAGENATDQQNVDLLLSQLKKCQNRNAYFVCVICYYISPKKYYFFRGQLDGIIATSQSGTGGFGYDPIFIPNSSNKTLSNFTPKQKNSISHRAIAISQLKNFLSIQV